MLKVNILILNALLNEVIVHFDMLKCVCVEHGVSSQMNNAHVVAVRGNWILDGNAQVLQNPLELYKFTCNRTVSHAAMTLLLYLAYVIESATIGCLLVQEMAPLPRVKKNPEVDRWLAL